MRQQAASCLSLHLKCFMLALSSCLLWLWYRQIRDDSWITVVQSDSGSLVSLIGYSLITVSTFINLQLTVEWTVLITPTVLCNLLHTFKTVFTSIQWTCLPACVNWLQLKSITNFTLSKLCSLTQWYCLPACIVVLYSVFDLDSPH